MPRNADHFHREMARLASEGTNSENIACRAASVWRKLVDALSPIIGSGGVTALLLRSVATMRTAHPWLASLQTGLDPPDHVAALQTALSQQSSAEAAAANSAVLQKFIEILSTLIGASLAERLLTTVWDDSSNDDSRES